MITLKVPNVIAPEAYERVKALTDQGLMMLIMDPQGDVDTDDFIGQVENIVEMGIDFEVLVSITHPHRFVPDSAFLFEVHNREQFIFLVQKEPRIAKTPV